MHTPRVLETSCGSIVKYNVSNYHPRIFTDDDLIPSSKSVGDTCPPYLPANPLTGEIAPDGCYFPLNSNGYKEFNYSNVKGDNWQSVKKTFARLRDLINCNFENPSHVLFITFTYDPKKLQSELTLKKVGKDMANTFARMRISSYLPSFEYIYVVEQQGNGRWHSHCLFFFSSRPPAIPQHDLECFWQHGWVKISKRFDDNKFALQNAGAYVCCDLCDWESNDHKRVKNARLLNYPSNAHLYRCSKGIKRPVKREISYDTFKEIEPDSNLLTYSKTNTIELDKTPYYFQYSHYERLYLDFSDILHLVGNVPPLRAQVVRTICYVNLEGRKWSKKMQVVISNALFLSGVKGEFTNDKGETIKYAKGDFYEPGQKSCTFGIHKDLNIEDFQEMTKYDLVVNLNPSGNGFRATVIDAQPAAIDDSIPF